MATDSTVSVPDERDTQAANDELNKPNNLLKPYLLAKCCNARRTAIKADEIIIEIIENENVL